MLPDFANSIAVFEHAKAEKLYQKLLLQLKRDFDRANIDLAYELSIAPNDLKVLLHQKVYNLLLKRSSDYLNLIYIVDIPEKDIKSIASNDLIEVSEQVCFLILKREWQKVWLKRQYTA